MELISKERLVNEIRGLAIGQGHIDWEKEKFTASEIMYIVKRQKQVESRPKGKWVTIDKTRAYDIEGEESWAIIIQCTNCMFETHAIEGHTAQYRFCPSCGAWNCLCVGQNKYEDINAYKTNEYERRRIMYKELARSEKEDIVKAMNVEYMRQVKEPKN